MPDTHPRRRLITFGLITVLFILTVCSIGATTIIWYASRQANESVQLNDLYQQAHYLVRAEDASMNEYILLPGSEGRAEFGATVQEMSIVLQTIVQDGDAGDRAFVYSVLPEHARYLVLVDQFFAFVDAHNLVGALDINNEQIAPLFDPMDKQIGTASDEDHQLATQSLATLANTQRIIIVSNALIFAVGLFLLMVFWWVMRGYQRQLDKAMQAELLRMEQTALTDPLTGLPNHRTVMDQIEAELLRCQRTQETCAVVFVDMDHFKQINDTWGHRTGDAVLREASRRLKENIRQEDAVGRYGGEEFVLVLANTDLQTARQAAERLLVVFAGEPCILEPENNTLVGNIIFLTASIGVAVYGEHGTTCEALIEAADQAMYTAKQNGRNQVCVAGEKMALIPQVLTEMSQEPNTETVGVKP